MPTPHLPKTSTPRTPAQRTTPAQRATFHTDGKPRTVQTHSITDFRGHTITADVQVAYHADKPATQQLVITVPAAGTRSGVAEQFTVPANTEGLPADDFVNTAMQRALTLAAQGKTLNIRNPEATPEEVLQAMHVAINIRLYDPFPAPAQQAMSRPVDRTNSMHATARDLPASQEKPPQRVNGVIPGSKEDTAKWQETMPNYRVHTFESGVVAAYRFKDKAEGIITIHNIPIAGSPNLTRSVQIITSGPLHAMVDEIGAFNGTNSQIRDKINTAVRAAVRLIMAGHELPPSTTKDSPETAFQRIIKEADKLPPLPPSQRDTHLDTGIRLAAVTPESVEAQPSLPNAAPSASTRTL